MEGAAEEASTTVLALRVVASDLSHVSRGSRPSHSNDGTVGMHGWVGHLELEGSVADMQAAWKWLVSWSLGPRRHHAFGKSRLELSVVER